jgi:sigma-B regulation protein RsbU (phosphoserine phosphatase)
MSSTPSPDVLRDVEAISRLRAVPTILRVISETTGLRFTLVARVTDDEWVACAVHDELSFGLRAGGALAHATTLCRKGHPLQAPVATDHASTDPVYCGHPTPGMSGFESYVSVPLFRTDGRYFGTVCGLDPRPLPVTQRKVMDMMQHFSELISLQLAADAREQAAQAELVKSEQTAQLREQFIAVLSHDLRNPLASVAMTTASLLRRPLSDADRKSVDRIRGSVRRMATMVTDLLDFTRAKLGSGLGVVMAEVTDLDSTLRHVVSELEQANPQRTVNVTIEPLGTVRCDSQRLGQLLSNLVANALIHGAPDQPIDVRAWRSAARHGETLVIEVHNQGAPISESVRERLFQPYTRGSPGSPQGLGLGLYIVEQISNAHGAALDVESTAESGTRFRFTLPVARTSQLEPRRIVDTSPARHAP